MQKKTSLFPKEKVPSNEFSNQWSYTNEHKQKNISKNFINRVKALDKNLAKTLDKESVDLTVLEKRTRLCNDKTKKDCSNYAEY